VFPQVAGQEHAGAPLGGAGDDADDDGYVSRVRRWLKQSF